MAPSTKDRTRHAPHKMWAAFLLLPVFLASWAAPSAGHATPCPLNAPAHESEESGNHGKNGKDLGQKCCPELEALNRRSPARVRAPRSLIGHNTAIAAAVASTSAPLVQTQPALSWAAGPLVHKPIPILLHKQSFLI